MRINGRWTLSMLAIFCIYWKSCTVGNVNNISGDISIPAAAILDVEAAELPSTYNYSTCPVNNNKIIRGPISTEVCERFLRKERINHDWDADCQNRTALFQKAFWDADCLNWTAILQKAFSDILGEVPWVPSSHSFRRRSRRPPRAIRKKCPGLTRERWKRMPPDLPHYLLCGYHKQMMGMPEFIDLVFSTLREEVVYWVSYPFIVIRYSMALGMFWMHHGVIHARYVLLPRIRKAVKKLVVMWRIFILLAQKVSLYFALWVILGFLAEQANEKMKKYCNLSRKWCKLIAFIIPLMRCTFVTAAQPTGTASNSSMPAAAVVVGAGIAGAGAAAVAMHYSRSTSEGTDQNNTPPTKRRRCRSSLRMGAAAMSSSERGRKWRERQKRKADEQACGQGEQDGTEVDKDKDELEDIASGLDEAIQECIKECQEMLGSVQVGEGTFQARVCVICDRIIKVSDPPKAPSIQRQVKC